VVTKQRLVQTADWEDLKCPLVICRGYKQLSAGLEVLIGFSDLNETCVGQNGFHALPFMYCVHGQLPFGEGGTTEVCRPVAVKRSSV
jgi:hypothetical protein